MNRMNRMLAMLHTFKIVSISTIVSIFTILLFNACDRKQVPVEPDLDLIYDKVPLYDENKALIPYSFDKFKDILNQANYQYPHAETIARAAEYDAFKTSTFYANQDGDFYFTVSKEFNEPKVRSELRQVYIEPISGDFNSSNGWKTSNSNGNYWISDVKCFKPNALQSYTWMQVHGIDGGNVVLKDGTIVKSYNYPFIRLTWNRYQYGIYDHLWAVIIISYPRSPKIYEWVDLGSRPDDFINAEVHIQSNILTIIINHVSVYTRDMTYWEDEPNYFKAGVYINRYEDGGTAVVAYRNIRFENNASKVTHY